MVVQFIQFLSTVLLHDVSPNDNRHIPEYSMFGITNVVQAGNHQNIIPNRIFGTSRWRRVRGSDEMNVPDMSFGEDLHLSPPHEASREDSSTLLVIGTNGVRFFSLFLRSLCLLGGSIVLAKRLQNG